jgi:hypothetical protein
VWISYLGQICCSVQDVTVEFLNMIACGQKPNYSELFSKHLYTAIAFLALSKYHYNID